METKELRIQVPKGYEIDKEKSTFENIVFKKKEEKRWRDDETAILGGYYIGISSNVLPTAAMHRNERSNYNIFATEKQAKSALAMARISQIMVNDKRFGGPVTDKERIDVKITKFCIGRRGNEIIKVSYFSSYEFLAFHTEKQRDLFLEENEDLVKEHLML